MHWKLSTFVHSEHWELYPDGGPAIFLRFENVKNRGTKVCWQRSDGIREKIVGKMGYLKEVMNDFEISLKAIPTNNIEITTRCHGQAQDILKYT